VSCACRHYRATSTPARASVPLQILFANNGRPNQSRLIDTFLVRGRKTGPTRPSHVLGHSGPMFLEESNRLDTRYLPSCILQAVIDDRHRRPPRPRNHYRHRRLAQAPATYPDLASDFVSGTFSLVVFISFLFSFPKRSFKRQKRREKRDEEATDNFSEVV